MTTFTCLAFWLYVFLRGYVWLCPRGVKEFLYGDGSGDPWKNI